MIGLVVLLATAGAPESSLATRRLAHDRRVERGAYLAKSVGRCLDCHSPLDSSNPARPRAGKVGAGDVWDPRVPVVAPNITPDPETGVGRWTDTQLGRAIRESIGHQPRGLEFSLPWGYFSVLTDDDLASIVAYVRTLPAVHNPLPRRPMRPGPDRETLDAGPFDREDLRDPVHRGEYLVHLGQCVVCHTPRWRGVLPLEGMLFGGGRRFEIRGGYGVEVDPDPWLDSAPKRAKPPSGLVAASANITPDASGIPYYDEQIFIKTIRTGRVAGVRAMSPAMPWIWFRNLNDEDLRAIHAFLRTLSPVRHRVNNTDPPTLCRRCGRLHGLGDLNAP